jgi:hypothetical protein
VAESGQTAASLSVNENSISRDLPPVGPRPPHGECCADILIDALPAPALRLASRLGHHDHSRQRLGLELESHPGQALSDSASKAAAAQPHIFQMVTGRHELEP